MYTAIFQNEKSEKDRFYHSTVNLCDVIEI